MNEAKTFPEQLSAASRDLSTALFPQNEIVENSTEVPSPTERIVSWMEDIAPNIPHSFESARQLLKIIQQFESDEDALDFLLVAPPEMVFFNDYVQEKGLKETLKAFLSTNPPQSSDEYFKLWELLVDLKKELMYLELMIEGVESKLSRGPTSSSN